MAAPSQRTLTMFVGVVALRYQHHTAHALCGVDQASPKPQSVSALADIFEPAPTIP